MSMTEALERIELDAANERRRCYFPDDRDPLAQVHVADKYERERAKVLLLTRAAAHPRGITDVSLWAAFDEAIAHHANVQFPALKRDLVYELIQTVTVLRMRRVQA